jgi:hypothetical protein
MTSSLWSKCQTRKIKKIYNDIDFKFINSIGSFSSINSQIIKPNKKIIFDNTDEILNCNITNYHNINILSSGLYIIHFNAIFESVANIAVTINNLLDDNLITSSNTNSLTLFQTIYLKKSDIISVINNGLNIIKTKQIINDNKNIIFTINKIMNTIPNNIIEDDNVTNDTYTLSD